MLVSVVMAVYNAEEYLCEAVESILNQTEKLFEFIIIDDGSTDGSLEILEEYALNDDRIVLLKNLINLGLPSSLNRGINLAKGEYIARQDADDRSAKNRLETQLLYALNHQDVDMIGSNALIIDMLGDVVCENRSFSSILDQQQAILNRKAILYHGSAFIKKSVLLSVGLYDTRFYYSQDGELWLRLLANGAKIHIIKDCLYHYRVLPVKTNKKYNAQGLYHVVKRMIYVDQRPNNEVDVQLSEIKSIITIANPQTLIPDFMAIYWKSLANTSYFNQSVSWCTPFKYLLKAYRQNLSAISKMQFFKLGFMYIIPKSIVNASLKK